MKKILSYILILILGFNLCSCTFTSNEIVSVSNPEEIEDITTQSLNSIYDFMIQNQDRFISDSNNVYSPINIYIALGMLSEITSGSTSNEIKSVLNQSDKQTVLNLINSTYKDNNESTILLGNSLWMSDKINYKKATLEKLAKYYHAYSFSGEMGSSEYDQQIQSWVNEQTKDLLKDQVSSIQTKSSTVLELLSTIYFKESWLNEFDSNSNITDAFHCANADVQTVYMCSSSSDYSYYKGDGYSMVSLPFSDGERMWFILPDDSLSNMSKTDYLAQIKENAGDYCLVNLKLPKFDITSTLDLTDIMESMGIKKVFGGGDFSNLTQDGDVELSKAEHNARIKIDEEGCEAAAYTEMQMNTTAMLPNQEIDFVLNKPFLFVVTSNQNVPLFSGVIENPNEEK